MEIGPILSQTRSYQFPRGGCLSCPKPYIGLSYSILSWLRAVVRVTHTDLPFEIFREWDSKSWLHSGLIISENSLRFWNLAWSHPTSIISSQQLLIISSDDIQLGDTRLLVQFHFGYYLFHPERLVVISDFLRPPNVSLEWNRLL